jgi:uncharacterized protein (TIGR02594 family)
MAYQTKQLTVVRASPAIDAEVFSVFGPGKVLMATGKKFDSDPANVWFNVVVPPGLGDGWLQKSTVDEVPDPARPDVDAESFVRQCIVVERSFNVIETNAPWFVLADFLIARAVIEAGTTAQAVIDKGVFANPGPAAGSDAVGPLRVSSAEWNGFLNGGQPVASAFGPKDFDFPLLQVYGAANRMRVDAQAISKESPADATAAANNDPFLPSYLDLFHAYLTDAKTAFKISKQESDVGTKIGDVIDDTQFAAIKARPQFNAIDKPDTLASLVSKTEATLNAALKDAFDLITKFAPDELPQITPGKADWLDVAKAELKSGVTEQSKPDRIKSYFAATDFGPVRGGIPHWCGAFVAFCMKQSNHQDGIPKGAALAANWKGFGQAVPAGSPDIPVGAVIVLKPSPGTNTSGHVAFFTEPLPATKQIRLLGGNQDNSVKLSAFSTSRLAAIRWLETQPQGAGAASGKFNLKAAGVPQKFWQFGDMIVDRFARAGFSGELQLAAVANAIAESGLDPRAESPRPERSFGLFQCNQAAGLGIGFTKEQLFDADTNIGIIIKEVKKFPEVVNAHTVLDAVRAFVKFIERPRNTEAAVIKRMAFADKLMRPIASPPAPAPTRRRRSR